MEIKTRKLLRLVGSPWLFWLTMCIFIAETSWLALTTRFPMAFDEQYHFDLIQFFSHRLNPIVTSQTSSTYKLGALVQNSSFLYHYLLSFPYRLITLFTKSAEIQVIGLRLINVTFAVIGLLIMRRLLKLLNLSDSLVNLVIVVFALTPIFTALSAQINYDNLLIPLVGLCAYETILFCQELDRKVFNTARLWGLLCLCLFSSFVQFAFLPIFVAILVIVTWKIFSCVRTDMTGLAAKARKNLASISRRSKWLLLIAGILGSFLFVRFYGVNVVKYHSPVPQCNQVLNIQDCQQYYAWDSNYVLQQLDKVRPAISFTSVMRFSAYWLSHSTLQIFGAILPLKGLYYVSPVLYFVAVMLGGAGVICLIANFKKILRQNKELLVLTFLSLVYLVALWARNYHDYLQLGQAVAISGRYWLPVLIYLYALMAVSLRYALQGKGLIRLTVRLSLSVVLLLSFAAYGGFMQYIIHITPVYGHIGPSDQYSL